LGGDLLVTTTSRATQKAHGVCKITRLRETGKRLGVESFDVPIVAALVLRSDVCLSETPESWLAVLAAVDSP